MTLEYIKGKPVYTVEEHHHVLQAWREIRALKGTPPLLISLDRHADTHPAFSKLIHKDVRSTGPLDLYKLVAEYCSKFELGGGNITDEAIHSLRHDEHIDAAARADIIRYAFVITFQNAWPSRRKNRPSYLEWLTFLGETHGTGIYDECPLTPYDVPENRIFEILITSHPCYAESPDDLKTEKATCDSVIESFFLNFMLDEVFDMAEVAGINDLLKEAFILDIDLDYFRTEKSIKPYDATTLHKLIQKSCAITIATEPGFVQTGRFAGEQIDANVLRSELLAHIDNAL